jgi:hypothetical protein
LPWEVRGNAEKPLLHLWSENHNLTYAQVTAATGGEYGILDVLSVTRSGRLAILELKANEDPVFPLQAAK